MKILLIGKTGQLGSALLPALAAYGTVLAPDRRELNLVEPASVTRGVRDTKPDLIVNAAAYTAVDQAEKEPEQALAVNGRGPGLLAQAAREVGAAFLHYSTDYVFDGEKSTPYLEDDITHPINTYGRSKRAGEMAVASAGLPHLILRTSWLYAATGRNFLTGMVRLAKERERISVVGDQVGAPTSVPVLVRTTLEILSQASDDPGTLFDEKGGIVHAACQGETSWYGFSTAIFEEVRRRGVVLKVREIEKISTEEFGAPARRPAQSRLDLSRLQDRFGITPPHWRDALTETCATFES